ncbi:MULTISPECIES: hypothetical protein [Clostridium]|uniref:Uncharacterized protein n=1 Tax=Clostridium beijerinckii TaxID=1520 RepID=A0A1S9N5Z7_CLOBE|nr:MULTISPECIES: hypothetical protein [Clostridium]EKQ57741.1 MAG: hypothetical protein A370_00628 [Clostridium sp. Maddingley MBC34-26]MZK52604.1 hypothetical protein [Clostridium beijerinckii]MZK60642.1 hypothetical protein [Clostridium beijerinckii]MZK70917.1 hypothetical protein [Clostridium beijerinckii]MZK76272.1 hypothetical protein [Clostridium beijerinckii]
MKLKRPVLVTFIAYLNLLGAFFIIISFFPIQKLIEQFGILIIPISDLLDGAIRISSALVMLIISYGYFRLKKWGYGLMITYNLFFLVLSMIFIALKIKNSYNTQGIIQSLVGLIITFPSKRYFIKENEDL